MTESRVNWWVIIDRAAEDRWRASLGQADIDAWCAAHGWNADDVVSDSVMVSSLSDGRIEVMAEVVGRGPDGRVTARGDGFDTHLAWAEYSRPLPEGIAPIQRPSRG